MGFLNLFNRNKGVDLDKAIDNTFGILDRIKYTKEEQAEDYKAAMELRMKVADKLSNFAIATHGENSERSVFRRKVGMRVINVYTALTFGTIAAYFFGKTEDVNFLLQILGLWSFGFGSVIMFLFGGYYLDKLGLKLPNIKEAISKTKKQKDDV